MKTKILSLAGILLFFICENVNSKEVTSKKDASQPESITISCAPELYSMASQWVSEYAILKPEMKVKLVDISDNSANSAENLSFVSTQSLQANKNELNWKMVIGRDVIVPIVNSGNPYLAQLMLQGISQEKFTQMFNNQDKQNWGTLLADGKNAAIHIYVSNDESVKAGISGFLQFNQIPKAGIILGTNDEVVSAIQKDPYAIGFCKAINVIVPDNKGFVENIKILPIDKNGNGTIDYMENIYSDANSFLRGVWIGKYPKTLYSNIYAVSKVQPTGENEIAFLSWVLTDGQQYLNSNGYCALVNTESQSQINKINTAIVSISSGNEKTTGIVLLSLVVAIGLGIVIIAGVRRYWKQAPAIPDINDSLPGFDENSIEVPKGIYFNRSHSWAFMEKDGNVSIGIDDFLQHVTGPITRVEMRNPGEKIKKGERLFSIVQSGKQLTLYSPISGIIKQLNETLKEDASMINSSPFSDGWIYRIEPSNWFMEINFMNMSEKYKKWINTEFSRMKDFLAATLKPDSLEYSHVVLQDGGILKDGVLADFGPEVWDDFQTNFLEIYK